MFRFLSLGQCRAGFRAGQTGHLPRGPTKKGPHQMELRYPRPSEKMRLAAHITPKYILPRGPHSLKSGPGQGYDRGVFCVRHGGVTPRQVDTVNTQLRVSGAEHTTTNVRLRRCTGECPLTEVYRGMSAYGGVQGNVRLRRFMEECPLRTPLYIYKNPSLVG